MVLRVFRRAPNLPMMPGDASLSDSCAWSMLLFFFVIFVFTMRGHAGLYSGRRHWENYVSISFHIEWDMIVVTIFFLILSQMDFYLVQNWKENCHNEYIPFNVHERDWKYSFLSDYAARKGISVLLPIDVLICGFYGFEFNRVWLCWQFYLYIGTRQNFVWLQNKRKFVITITLRRSVIIATILLLLARSDHLDTKNAPCAKKMRNVWTSGKNSRMQ